MTCMCARAREIGNMKYRGNPRVSPGFPDFYLTHKQCDRDGAARGLTGAPRDYINNNDLLCKQLQVVVQGLPYRHRGPHLNGEGLSHTRDRLCRLHFG